ncbi:GNAT family N-acetyltransferase [Pseudorhodoferax sp.]|uniref:GNAT family N-acetyltransferase n=1 Tax=Pseudorhodoferax sp. TaxID=1993553 RepID=UPI002DD62FA6|nr:GNAT family N-acetyltransferase [Pseudorhodoferax sp.]
MTGTPGPAWTVRAFDDFPVRELYEVLRLRSAVFVVEQQCLFEDMDGLDARALHLLGHGADGQLLAYARCFDKGVAFAEASIGRVITRTATRGSGLGHRLIARAIALVGERWGVQPIRIGAQARLRGFYEGHGFVDLRQPYVEDGIDHLEMLWQPE